MGKKKGIIFLLQIQFWGGGREREKINKIKIHQTLDIIFKKNNPEMKITS